MKIAVACDSPSPTALVSLHFGRARWFLIYDTKSKRIEATPHALPNGFTDEAGIKAARLIIQAQAGAVVSDNFGDTVRRMLNAAHVTLHATTPRSTAARALSDFQLGTLRDL